MRIGKEVWYIENWLSLKHYPPKILGGYLIDIEEKFIKIQPYGCKICFVLIPQNSNYWGYLPKE